ncbi:MAG: long-chain-fatty-acid--CoA ligase [bacterium]|nr:MAG: long-chain-fatty-acid--CoA ligase [bacterium]
MIKENLVEYFQTAIKENWEKPAVSDYNGKTITFREVGETILKFHIIFEKTGIKRGDKIALIGKNSANWAVAYLAVITYGAVIVPILPDFLPKDVHFIVNHSESKAFIAASSIWSTLDIDQMLELRFVMGVEELMPLFSRINHLEEVIHSLNGWVQEKYPRGLNAENFALPPTGNEQLGEISYTSGTTGFSKGVMLLHNSLAANVRFARAHMPLESGDKIVSFLPLAHAYGLAFEFLFPFSLGCHITFLTKTPGPQVITRAFQEIKPRLILSVPLVIEKIYKKKILPVVNKSPISWMLKTPLLNKLIYKKVLAGVSEGFGGNFVEVVVGGAALSHEIENFFRQIGFPITVGYGMTECGPLISYAPAKDAKIESCGIAVDTLEVKIDSKDPENEVGEILMRGENVMMGYYRNEEATKMVLDKDGWLHSGDLGLMDKDGFIFIKGRSKSLILGPSGQNIYPEEIESKLNNRACVAESIVIQRDGKLTALVYPDEDVVKSMMLSNKELEDKLENYRKEMNKEFPFFMAVSRIVLHPDPFEKTPKLSIKRFMYQ